MIKGVKDHIKRFSKFSRHVCFKLSQNSKKKILSEGVKENEERHYFNFREACIRVPLTQKLDLGREKEKCRSGIDPRQ